MHKIYKISTRLREGDIRVAYTNDPTNVSNAGFSGSSVEPTDLSADCSFIIGPDGRLILADGVVSFKDLETIYGLAHEIING